MELLFKKYWIAIILAGILLLALAIGLLFIRGGLEKIPSRGVFVMIKRWV